MDAKVADLIFQIIGNGKPCSKSDWKAIKKELDEIKKPSNNKQSEQICSDCVIKKACQLRGWTKNKVTGCILIYE